MGLGHEVSPLAMARPHFRGQVTNPSKKEEQSAKHPQQASRGCRMIQIEAQKKAIGHAKKISKISQIKEKQTLAMWLMVFCVKINRERLLVSTRRSEE